MLCCLVDIVFGVSMLCCLVDIVFGGFLLLLRLSGQQIGFDVHSCYYFYFVCYIFPSSFRWLFIIFATSFYFSHVQSVFVVMVYMSSIPVSIYSVSVSVDWGTISTRRMIFSCFRFSDFVSFCLYSSCHLHMLCWAGCRSLLISMRFQVICCCSICFPLWLGWFGMLLLFSVMFLLCDFPLFLYYSWFRPDIYMFVRIPCLILLFTYVNLYLLVLLFILSFIVSYGG